MNRFNPQPFNPVVAPERDYSQISHDYAYDEMVEALRLELAIHMRIWERLTAFLEELSICAWGDNSVGIDEPTCPHACRPCWDDKAAEIRRHRQLLRPQALPVDEVERLAREIAMWKDILHNIVDALTDRRLYPDAIDNGVMPPYRGRLPHYRQPMPEPEDIREAWTGLLASYRTETMLERGRFFEKNFIGKNLLCTKGLSQTLFQKTLVALRTLKASLLEKKVFTLMGINPSPELYPPKGGKKL